MVDFPLEPVTADIGSPPSTQQTVERFGCRDDDMGECLQGSVMIASPSCHADVLADLAALAPVLALMGSVTAADAIADVLARAVFEE